MRKLFTLFLVTFLAISASYAQKVSGFVKDAQGKGLDKSTVSLLNAKDSSTMKLSVTDNSGKFSLEAPAGQYLVSVSHVGYIPTYSKVFDLSSDMTLQDLVVEKAEGNLEGVTVSSKKPMVEVQADKMIVNVEGTINAVGNDALELLRKSPGVTLDKDENISLAGKNGVQFYIDGRPTPLTGADLTAYLKSLQSSQIEAIEIITNPSAKYDAAGNAGIINIRLKKNKAFGTNGSVQAGYGIGIQSKYNGGFSLNHRQNKVSLFSNYNYNWAIDRQFFSLYRDVADSIFNQQSQIRNKGITHGFKAGMDYFINPKHTVGVILSGNLNDGNTQTYSRTDIAYKQTKITDRILYANNRGDQDRNNLNANFNYRFADTTGHTLNVDVDYGRYRITSDQYQPNDMYNSTETVLLQREVFNILAPTDIDIYTGKADYEQNFLKGKLGLGAKISFVKSINDFQTYNVDPNNDNNKEADLGKTNKFDYKENVNAGYINYNRQLKGMMIQLGLRVENTNSDGHSTGFRQTNTSTWVAYDSVIERHYTDFFPSAAVTFNKNPMSQWNFTYSRRIDRPAYQDLNPFEFRLDKYTYQKGNTTLRPQYTHNVGVTHTYKYRLNTSLTYSHVSDVFTQLVDTTDQTKGFISKQNLATQDIVSMNVSYPFQYKSYTAFGNVNAYYSHYIADFGGGNRKINLDVFAYNVYMQHSIRFGKTKLWTGEVSGWYNSPSIWGGTFKSRALWSVDAGLQKTIFKGQGNIKMAVSDIFQTIRWKGVSDFASQYLVAKGGYESRQFKVNLTWRFGSATVKAARERKTASEDETKRVGTQGTGISQ
jgi:iron complex outermembrane recepter protein